MLGLLLIPVAVQAQTKTSDYVLHRRSPAEYASAVSELLKSANDDLMVNPQTRLVAEDVLYRFINRDAQASYAQLLALYHVIASSPNRLVIDLGLWNREIIFLWLREHSVDLDKTPLLTFDDYIITVTPRDFKGDGSHEWLLTITNTFDALHAANYFIAARDDTGIYKVIQTPLPWFSEGFAYWNLQSGSAQSLLFQDINGDGVPEWVVAIGGVGGGHMSYGQLYILTWQKAKIVNLATYGWDNENSLDYESPAGGGAPIFPGGVTLEFVKSLKNNTLDIIVRHELYDTWDCRWLETRTFSWNNSIYVLSNRVVTYHDSQGCAWRNAEASAWKGDNKAAIAYYEHGLSLSKSSWSYSEDQQNELRQYIRFRLALAESLMGQAQQAADLLQVLQTEKPASELMREFIEAATSVPASDAYSLCMAAYNVINQYFLVSAGPDTDARFYGALPTNIVIGMTLDNYGPPIGLWQDLPDPLRAGCDISVPLLDKVVRHGFRTTDHPLWQLSAMGIPIQKSFSADLNNDGIPEWLVWLSLPTPPLLFTSDPNTDSYMVSYAPLSHFDISASMTLRTLPDDSGKAIAVILGNPDHLKNCPPPKYGTYEDYKPPQSILKMWRIESGKLTSILESPNCETDNNDPFQIVPTEKLASAVSGWALITNKKPGYPADYTQASFQWDSVQKVYKLPSVIPISPDDPRPARIPIARDYLCDIAPAFESRDYPAALKAINAALLSPCKDCQNDDYLAMHYWRATALELNGDDSAALAEYVFIYTSAPSEFWRTLAGLHLQPFF